MTAKHTEQFLLQYLLNSEKLVESGFDLPALCIEGPAGVGKTSVIGQVAKKLGYSFVQRNLGEAEDLGVLFGFPIVKYRLTKGDDETWAPKELLEPLISAGYKYHDQTKMSFSPPDWVPTDPNSKGILLLDDFTRALPIFMQATMTLVDTRSYGNWKLPDGWIVVLSSNPDNGEYSVSSLDPAQKTRFLTAKMEGSAKDWAAWAERAGIDNRVINFVLANEEMFVQSSGKEINKDATMNFRILTKFLVQIGALDDFNSNLGYINTLATDTFGETFAALFNKFIVLGLDKLPSIDSIFKSKDGVKELVAVTGEYTDPRNYNTGIAGILAIRLINFVSNNKDWDQKKNEITKNLVISKAFDLDLKMFIIRQCIVSSNNSLKHFLPTHPEVKPFITSIR